MTINSSHFRSISAAFNIDPSKKYLQISKESDGSYAFNVSSTKSTSDSLNLFEEMLGKNRLHRICNRKELKLNPIKPLSLSKNTVQKILMGMMHIQKEDLEEIEGPIADRFERLVLFDQFSVFEQACIKAPPSIDRFSVDKAEGSGKGFKGLVEKVTLLNHHHFTLKETSSDETSLYRDVEMLTSRIGDREMEKGMALHLRDGYFYVDEVFARGGAYVSILRDFENKLPPKIVCRGTAMRKKATGRFSSGLNDILLQIGIEGVKQIWPDLSNYLSKEAIKEVEIMGKSLGGAHAQELAVLIEGIQNITVTKLTTYCSVGVGKEINRLFHKEVLSKRTTPFQIQVIRNGGNKDGNENDYVPAIGGVHLGVGSKKFKDHKDKCQRNIVYIHPDASPLPLPLIEGGWDRFCKFLSSFRTPHCRQTTLKDFHWTKIKDEKEINAHLRIGNKLETLRKFFAHLFNIFTFGLINGRSFRSFYNKQKEEAAASTPSSATPIA